MIARQLDLDEMACQCLVSEKVFPSLASSEEISFIIEFWSETAEVFSGGYISVCHVLM